MSRKVTCGYCGLPFQTTKAETELPAYCCTGCSMVARIPVDDQGQFPINGPLLQLLAGGFLFFNQALFWALGLLLAHQGKTALADRFGWVTYSLAVVFGLLLFLGNSPGGGERRKGWDWFISASVFLVYLLAWRVIPPSGLCMLLANVGFVAWSLRGLWLKRLRKF